MNKDDAIRILWHAIQLLPSTLCAGVRRYDRDTLDAYKILDAAECRVRAAGIDE
jgi:hypothetical protein